MKTSLRKTEPQILVKRQSDPEEKFYSSIRTVIQEARAKAYRSVNFIMVEAYWNVGRLIMEEEQKGLKRAGYGDYLIVRLAEKLQGEFGSGFDERNLRNMRAFYRAFSIRNAVRSELSWTHYRLLLKVEKEDARKYYMEEAIAGNVLEFLNLKDYPGLHESTIEQAIINNLQHFLLELGKGFSFVARQKRMRFEEEDFYADLVFYNYILSRLLTKSSGCHCEEQSDEAIPCKSLIYGDRHAPLRGARDDRTGLSTAC